MRAYERKRPIKKTNKRASERASRRDNMKEYTYTATRDFLQEYKITIKAKNEGQADDIIHSLRYNYNHELSTSLPIKSRKSSIAISFQVFSMIIWPSRDLNLPLPWMQWFLKLPTNSPFPSIFKVPGPSNWPNLRARSYEHGL